MKGILKKINKRFSTTIDAKIFGENGTIAEETVILDLLKRVKFRICGKVFLYERQKEGHDAPMPYYLVRCKGYNFSKVHSHTIVTRPYFRDDFLLCPLCEMERKKFAVR